MADQETRVAGELILSLRNDLHNEMATVRALLSQNLTASLEAIAMEFFSSRSVRTWNGSSAAAILFHAAELVRTKQVRSAKGAMVLAKTFSSELLQVH